MKVSIVVPAYNEERVLAASLQSIRDAAAAFHEAGWHTELIVCDNNSTDRTAEIARDHGARVVFEPINQISRARNAGAAAATGEWLLFVDADSHPSRALFADVVIAVESGRVAAGGSTVSFERPDVSVAVVGHVWNAISRTMRWVAGSFIFCESALFRELGGFSLELYAAEEIELSRRLKRAVRRRGQRVAILHRHPLVTSTRKAHLYAPSEMAGFLVRTLLQRGRTLRSPEACFSWYDGRR
jgi:glycosyltransferase involved in cell wall biosynthesis